MKLTILTGASGAGKTTLTSALVSDFPELRCFFFDSIGVPSPEKMIADFGSGEAWQRATMIEWISKIRDLGLVGSAVLEGQVRISFIEEALRIAHVSAQIVLIDCNDEVRRARLYGPRAQPDLATTDMMNWARFLRDEASRSGHQIIDTSGISLADGVRALAEICR